MSMRRASTSSRPTCRSPRFRARPTRASPPSSWSFPWVSSLGSDFNFDYHVSFRPEELARKAALYNYTTIDPGIDELPGESVFVRDDDGTIYHSYSSYARGGEALIGAFMFLDMVPKGRNEPDSIMQWVRHHDRYDN